MGALSGYNLSPNQLRDLHNAGCYFHSFIERYRDVLGKQVIEDFERPWNLFSNVRKEILEVENKVFEEKHAYYDKIRNDNLFLSRWSIYEIDDVFQPSHVVGATKIVYSTWDGDPQEAELDPSHTYTWIELWSIADKMVRDSGDRHHVFVEKFSLKDGVVKLLCGS